MSRQRFAPWLSQTSETTGAAGLRWSTTSPRSASPQRKVGGRISCHPSFSGWASAPRSSRRYNPTLLTNYFSATFRTFFAPFFHRSFAVSGFLAPRRSEGAKNGVKCAKFGRETAEKQQWLSSVRHAAAGAVPAARPVGLVPPAGRADAGTNPRINSIFNSISIPFQSHLNKVELIRRICDQGAAAVLDHADRQLQLVCYGIIIICNTCHYNHII